MVAAVYGGDRVAVPGDERCDVLDRELRPVGKCAVTLKLLSGFPSNPSQFDCEPHSFV